MCYEGRGLIDTLMASVFLQPLDDLRQLTIIKSYGTVRRNIFVNRFGYHGHSIFGCAEASINLAGIGQQVSTATSKIFGFQVHLALSI
jgi:hypothetical protein